VRDAGFVLVPARGSSIDHLPGRVLTGGQRFHDLVADASLPPAHDLEKFGAADVNHFTLASHIWSHGQVGT